MFLLLFFPFYHHANVPFHLLPRKSVNHVMNHPKQQTLSFVVSRRGLGQVFPNFLWQSAPSTFRFVNMYLWNFLWQKGWGK